MRYHNARRRAATAAAVAATTAVAVAACAPSTPESDTAAAVDESVVEAALEEGGELLIWGWEATLEPTVAAFEDAYPNVDVTLVNVGTSLDHFTALQNAVAAGSGVPDVAWMPYYSIPQFGADGALADLRPFGAEDLAEIFAPGPWDSTHVGDAIYGLPADSGPRVMVYNETLFDQHGIAVPTTWEEYVEAARALRAADPEASILADNADTLKSLSHIWAAGGRPFAIDGTEVTIDLENEGTEKYLDVWQTLLDEDLLSPIRDYSDEWYQALGAGQIATMIMGAWITPSLTSGLPAGSGQWAVAPLPQFESDGYVTSELGGSALAVTEASQNKELAYGFVEYAAAGEGVDVRVSNGAFPAQTRVLNSEEFLEAEFEYYGGQQANKVFSESSAAVGAGWTYLPFQVYANSIFADYVGPAYTGEISLAEGLQQWADAVAAYGEDQGFTVVR